MNQIEPKRPAEAAIETAKSTMNATNEMQKMNMNTT